MMTEGMLVDDTLNNALRDVLEKVPGLVGIVLTDANGFPVSTSFMGAGIRESSAMGAVAVDLAVRISQHLKLGEFENITFSFSDSYVHLSTLANGKVHILVVAEKDINRGLLDLAMEEVKKVIGKLVEDLVYM